MYKYYVYVYLDPRKPGIYNYKDISFDHEPFYVGKGTGNRMNAHIYNRVTNSSPSYNYYKDRKINKIKSIGLLPIIIKIVENLTEEESFKNEIETILKIGRLKNGPLVNMSDGGEGQSGYKHTEESKIKTSNSIRNNKEWLKIVKSKEFSDKVSNSLMGHEGYGKGVSRSDEVKEKIRNSVSGDKNHFYGKTHSDQSKKDQSIRNSGKGNPNSKIYTIGIDENIIYFEGRLELKKFIDDFNNKNNLKGPSKVSTGNLLDKKVSKNFKLIDIRFLKDIC